MRRFHPLILFFTLNFWLLFSASCLQFRTSTKEAKREFIEIGIVLHGFSIQEKHHTLNAVWTGDSSKTNLLFIHGSPGSWSAFEEYLMDSILLEKFRIISVDRPGFGYNDFGTPQARLRLQAEEIIELMDSLDNGKDFYLAGHSLGGPIAIEIACLDTQRVKGIALLAASIDPDLEPREFFRPLLKPKWVKFLMPTSLWTSNYEIYYLMDELKKQKDSWKKVQCKILVMHGVNDKLVPVQNVGYAQKMYKGIYDFRKVILEEKNHFIPWTAMDTVRKELIIFASDGE